MLKTICKLCDLVYILIAILLVKQSGVGQPYVPFSVNNYIDTYEFEPFKKWARV